MKNILISLAALMLVLGCKKERVLYLSDDIKKNYSYKPGSYWIYRDSATGREDSCYVLNNYISLDEQYDRSTSSDYDKVEWMEIKMKLEAVNKGKNVQLGIRFYINNNELNGLFGDISNPQTFSSPLPINQQTFEKYNYGGSLEFLPSISLQGKEFLNTFKINDDFGLYYFNESIGLIKMRLTNDSVVYNWELVRHKVLK